jgi:hypothetical protein
MIARMHSMVTHIHIRYGFHVMSQRSVESDCDITTVRMTEAVIVLAAASQAVGR